jgi:hypothetical protein
MTNTMPLKAKVMIGLVAAVSLCTLWFGVLSWQMPVWSQLGLLISAAILTSRLKVRLPGVASTMSGNLPVILIGVTQLGLLGSLLVAATAAIAQSYASGAKTKSVHLFFNVCTLINACGLAYLAYHSQMLKAAGGEAGLPLVVATAAYFVANTAPVAGIIGLSEGRNPFTIWHRVFLWSFPNYVIGAGLTAIVSLVSATSEMATLATLLVVLFGVYKSYKTYVSQQEQTLPKTMAMASGR